MTTESTITTVVTAVTTAATSLGESDIFPILRTTTSTMAGLTSAVDPMTILPAFHVQCTKIIDPDVCSSFGCSYCYKIFWFQCSETCAFEPWMWWTAFLFPLMFCLLPLCVIFCCLSSKAESEKRNQVAMERERLRLAMMASRPVPAQPSPQVYNQYVVPPYDPYTAGQVYPTVNRDVDIAATEPYTQVSPEAVALAAATAESIAEAKRAEAKKEKDAVVLPPLEEKDGLVANRVAKIDRKVLVDTGDFVEGAAVPDADGSAAAAVSSNSE